MNYSKVLITAVKMALKASNQRIVQLDNTFGPNSTVVTDSLAFLKKGAFKKFTTVSNQGNVVTPTNALSQKIQHTKIDISKFVKAMERGDLTESELQAFLIQATGKKIINGELQNVAQGIPTLSSLKKEYENQYDVDLKKMSKKELLQELNERAETLSNFQTEYELVKNSTTLAEREKQYSFLFHKGQKWSYSDMSDMTQKLKELRKGVKKTLANNNKIGQEANDKLKNGV